MKIIVYGMEKEFPDGATVGDVLAKLDEPEKFILVEVNGAYIRHEDFATKTLAEGDRLEVIYPAFGD